MEPMESWNHFLRNNFLLLFVFPSVFLYFLSICNKLFENQCFGEGDHAETLGSVDSKCATTSFVLNIKVKTNSLFRGRMKVGLGNKSISFKAQSDSAPSKKVAGEK